MDTTQIICYLISLVQIKPVEENSLGLCTCLRWGEGVLGRGMQGSQKCGLYNRKYGMLHLVRMLIVIYFKKKFY